jgi:predicted GNAT family acetyltransferase
VKVDTANLDVKNNTRAQRFEVHLGDKLGVIQYHMDGSTYIFTHTEIPPEYRGQGIADRMTHVALETARAEGAQVVPRCPFVKAYIRRHKEYLSLVAS